MTHRSSPAALLCLALTAVFATSALAAELPKRKSGLWEMKNQMEGMPSSPAIKMCVDQNTDNIMQQRAKEKVNCPAADVSRSGDKVIIHSVCKLQDGTTATTDAVLTGDFEKGYRNDIKMHYSPPMHGMAEMKMISEAKWLGPCGPGQKPGDVILSGGTINMHEMAKQPQAPR